MSIDSTCRQQESPEAVTGRLGVKVTNYQDKDEVLGKSLGVDEQGKVYS